MENIGGIYVMKKRITLALVAATALTLTSCSASGDRLTATSAKEKIAAANISCNSLDEQDLGALLQDEEVTAGGALLVCSDEGSTFGLGIFATSDGIDSFLRVVCESASDDNNIDQLENYTLLWGENWFADATANPELTETLQQALGGDISSFASKCST
jgi:hypothetical protein